MSNPLLLQPPREFTHTARADGPWDRETTWKGNGVPAKSSVVHIPTDKQVIINDREAICHFVQVDGRLQFKATADTQLQVETLFVSPTGTLGIGRRGNPIRSDRTAEVIFLGDGPIDRGWDPDELSRGLISQGKIRVFGKPKTHWVAMNRDVGKGAKDLDLGTAVPEDWETDDEIVITGSHFRRDTPLQDERAKIASINGSVVTLDRKLQHDHVKARRDLQLYVANLTRNIVFRSKSTDLPHRGHIMLHRRDVQIHYAAFTSLGRTDKTVPLDEILVDTEYGTVTPNPDIRNRRGRYALHFHLAGSDPGQDPASEVEGCVVTDTPSWGFVNHSSHVDFRKNVCVDFAGAAFVTEAGDELGNFTENLAVHGTGNGEYRPIRIAFRNLRRPQPLADFGFSGDGFWFQGPAIRARDNVANSCNGAGMIWFTTGAVDIRFNRYTGFPPDAVATVYADLPDLDPDRLRRWGIDETVVIADLPILECDGFEASACLVGFHLRFNNHPSNAWYNEFPYKFGKDIVPVPEDPTDDPAERVRQSIQRLKLWNNEIGLRVRYVSKTDFSDLAIVNRQGHGQDGPVAGAELLVLIDDLHFDKLRIDGYEVAGWIESDTDNARGNVTFGDRRYSNFVSFDTWHRCEDPYNLMVESGSDTALITWVKNKETDRHMVRYRTLGSVLWQFATVEGTKIESISLSGLSPNRTYEYQVIASCPPLLSHWTPVKTFKTLPEE